MSAGSRNIKPDATTPSNVCPKKSESSTLAHWPWIARPIQGLRAAINASAYSSYPFDLSCPTLVGINGFVEVLFMNQARDPKTTEDLAASSGRARMPRYESSAQLQNPPNR